MAELKEDDLLPGELSEDDLAPEATSETLTERPDGVKVMKLEKVAQPLPEVTDEEAGTAPAKRGVGEFMSPHTATGAAAAGVNKGFTLGFGDELGGALMADSSEKERHADAQAAVEDQKRRDAHALVEAASHGVDALKAEQARQVGAAAPDMPSVTSYTLKRPEQPDVTKTAVAKSPHETEGTVEDGKARGEVWEKAYRGYRDQLRDQYKTAEKEHPYAFGAGELVGGVALPLPGPGKAKGLAKVGNYTLMGAGLGSAAGLGNSEAELADPEHMNVGGAASDTGWGTLGGAGSGAVLGAASAKLDPWLEKKAAERAFKSLDPYMKTISAELGPDATVPEIREQSRKFGQRMLDEDIIPRGPLERWSNSEELAGTALKKADEAGVLKGATVDLSQDALTKAGVPNPVSLGRLASQVELAAEEAGLNGNQELKRKLMKRATDIRQTIVDRSAAGFSDPAAQSLQDAEKFKTGLQGQVDYSAPLAKREAQTAVARLAKEQTENAIEKGLGPEELELFKAAKDRYGDLRAISNIANHGAVRNEIRNNTVGLGDKLAAGVGSHAVAGPMAIPAALATGAAHHLANHRGSAGLARTLANAADRYSPLLVPSAEAAADPQAKWKKLLGEEE